MIDFLAVIVMMFGFFSFGIFGDVSRVVEIEEGVVSQIGAPDSIVPEKETGEVIVPVEQEYGYGLIDEDTRKHLGLKQEGELFVYHIAPHRVECMGVGPMMCLVVNDELFYSGIKGFHFIEGTEYEIVVARTERERIPADASKYMYTLVKVLKAEKR